MICKRISLQTGQDAKGWVCRRVRMPKDEFTDGTRCQRKSLQTGQDTKGKGCRRVKMPQDRISKGWRWTWHKFSLTRKIHRISFFDGLGMRQTSPWVGTENFKRDLGLGQFFCGKDYRTVKKFQTDDLAKSRQMSNVCPRKLVTNLTGHIFWQPCFQ